MCMLVIVLACTHLVLDHSLHSPDPCQSACLLRRFVSLFPLLMRLLPAESPHLKELLQQLPQSDLLWSPYGLRWPPLQHLHPVRLDVEAIHIGHSSAWINVHEFMTCA